MNKVEENLSAAIIIMKVQCGIREIPGWLYLALKPAPRQPIAYNIKATTHTAPCYDALT